MNHVLALMMENDSPDKFAEDVANAYFANPAHVRSLLNENCINECVDYVMDNQRVEFDLSDLPLFEDEEPFFVKPSRQKGRRKHDKKAVKRKGSAKRFRDRSRKCASEGHMCKMYNRGMVGDWGVRGRRLAETGQVAFKTHQRLVRDIEIDPEALKEEETETRTFTYLEDGFTLTMSMSKSTWEKEEEDDFSPSFNWDRKYTPEWDFAENPPTWKTPDDDDDEDWLDWEDEWENDDDEIIGADCTQEQDTAEFSAVELAQITMRIATADPVQRARIRSFMKTL